MYSNPIAESAGFLQGPKNWLKWEVHPLYRIFFWDILNNQRSFGNGEAVYDRAAGAPTQLAQVTKYMFFESYRFYGKLGEMAGVGTLTTKEMEEQKRILDEGLNTQEKLLNKILGYSYVRSSLPERQAIYRRQLNNEYRKQVRDLNRKYKGETLNNKMETLKDWHKQCNMWIEKEMY